jgi:undecaprenyl-diphosphatase
MELLNLADAAARMRLVLRASVLLWLGTLMTVLMRADAALLQHLAGSRVFGSLRPALEWYADQGLFIFYAACIALFVYGMRIKRRLFVRVGLAYVFAQVFGTLLLVRLIKIGCGRPRPFVDAEAWFCEAPSLLRAFHSFPSSHVVNAAVCAMFVMLLLRSRAAALLAIAATLCMAMARIASGAHHLSDVLAGMALGVAITGVVMRLHLFPRWRATEASAAAR